MGGTKLGKRASKHSLETGLWPPRASELSWGYILNARVKLGERGRIPQASSSAGLTPLKLCADMGCLQIKVKVSDGQSLIFKAYTSV